MPLVSEPISFEASPPSEDFFDIDHPRRASSSPQLQRSRSRSDSASSSASLTATEDNYRSRPSRPSYSSPRFPVGYPQLWALPPRPQTRVSRPNAPGTSESEEDSVSEDSENHDDLVFVSRASSTTTVGSGSLRNRHGNTATTRRKDSEQPRVVTTARGRACAGETETELDDMPARLPTVRVTDDSTRLLVLPIDFLVRYLFEVSRLLSIVPAVFGIAHNIYRAIYPPYPQTGSVQLTSIDFVICAAWAALTGFQCLALTTGLLLRWKAYYATFSTLIRLVALQCICWPATHLTLLFFDHNRRPVICWALIGSTTCFSRSVQLWVTSNLYMPVSSVSDGRVLREEGRYGPRRWDWGAVIKNCILPAGILYFITAWAMLMKEELGY